MRQPARVLSALGLALAAVGGVFVLASSPAGAAPQAEAGLSAAFVAPSGGAGAPDVSCATAGYSSISAAVSAAPGGATVVVCPGTYHESVSLSGKSLRLQGVDATIDATGLAEGVIIAGSATAGSTLQGFQVENAEGEGVLVEGTSQVTVAGDTITDNDQVCNPQANMLNDCGEGLHLEAVTDSAISGNRLERNAGGILLDDGTPGATAYAGPTSGNRIAFNTAADNPYDCGITLASHNPKAVSATGTPQPGLGGVFDNTVIGNISNDNGVADGNGSGILLAAPAPGMGTYNNLVVDNQASGNGLAGITIHSHAPGQDVNGNRLVANVLGQNAVDGGAPEFDVTSPPSPEVPGDVAAGLVNSTVGIVIWSAATPVTGTSVVANRVFDDGDGIFVHNTADTQLAGNQFFDVTQTVVSS